MQKFIHFYRTQYYSNWRIIIVNALCFNALALASVCSCLYVWLCVCVLMQLWHWFDFRHGVRDKQLSLFWQFIAEFLHYGSCALVYASLSVCVCVYVFRCVACRLCVNHLIFTHPSRHVPNGHHLLLKFIDPLLIFGSALEIIMDLRCCCRSARVN